MGRVRKGTERWAEKYCGYWHRSPNYKYVRLEVFDGMLVLYKKSQYKEG